MCGEVAFTYDKRIIVKQRKNEKNRNSSAGDVIIFRSPAFFNTDERVGFM